MLLNLVHPILHILVTLLFRAVVTENYTISSFVISLRYSPEPLLARRVPDLEFNILAVYWDIFNLEIDSCER